MVIAIFVFTYLLSNSFITEEVIRKWETPVTPVKQIQYTFDVGIVLGGFSSFDTTINRLQFHRSGDRMWQALYLYKTGKVKKLLITGGSGSLLHRKDTEADRVYTFLQKLGVPAKDLIMEAKSRNTRENAVETAKIINASMPDANCILITSALHMKRAMGCFNKVHLKVIPYSTDFLAKPRRWDPDKLLVPNPESLGDWTSLLREIMGFYTYKMMGYL